MNNNLLFINNYDQSSGRDRELARSAACAHVARRGHSRRHLQTTSRTQARRQIRAKRPTSLDESLRLPPLLLHRDSDENNGEASTQPLADLLGSSTLTASVCAGTQLSNRGRHPTASPVTASRSASLRPLGPFESGNSDPFACMPVDITPDVNNIMTFFHTQLLELRTRGKQKIDSPHTEFQMVSENLIHDTNFHSLQDECAFRSFLVFASSIRAKVGQNKVFDSSYRRLQTESHKSLNSRLRKDTKADDYVLYSVMAHFCASIMSEDCEQAAYHGRFLRNLIMERVRDGTPVCVGFFKQALWADTQLACLRLQEGFLADDDWVPTVLHSIDHKAQVTLGGLPAELTAADSFDSTVSTQPLQGSIARLRQCFAIAAGPLSHSEESGFSTILFLLCHACLCQLSFIKHHLDMRAKLESPFLSSSKTQIFEYHLAATISMAIVYLIDAFASTVCCYTRYMPKSDKLLSSLQNEISGTLKHMNDTQISQAPYRNALLFVLFVAVQGEIYQAISQQRAPNRRFDRDLVLMARDLNLRSWKDAERIIKLFIYIEVLEPRGETWFDEVLGIQGGPEGVK